MALLMLLNVPLCERDGWGLLTLKFPMVSKNNSAFMNDFSFVMTNFGPLIEISCLFSDPFLPIDSGLLGSWLQVKLKRIAGGMATEQDWMLMASTRIPSRTKLACQHTG